MRDRSAPNPVSSDERGQRDPGAGRGQVQRYEQLRTCAVGGQPAGPMGLALLMRSGLAAWARAWPGAAPVPAGRRALALPADGGQQIVGVLADMALACLARS